MTDKCRDEFERWAGPQGLRLHIRDSKGSERFGQYCADDTQLAYEAFRAAWNTAKSETGEYVKHSDYADLLARMDVAEKDADRWAFARQMFSALDEEAWGDMLKHGHIPSDSGNEWADRAIDRLRGASHIQARRILG